MILSFVSKQRRRHNMWTEITRQDYERRCGAMPFPGCAISLPSLPLRKRGPPTRVRNCTGPWKRLAIGRWRSSNGPIAPRALKLCHAARSWNVPSPGLDAAVDWPRTGKNQSHPPRHGSSSLISDSSPDASQDIVIERRVSSQTLRGQPKTS